MILFFLNISFLLIFIIIIVELLKNRQYINTFFSLKFIQLHIFFSDIYKMRHKIKKKRINKSKKKKNEQCVYFLRLR